MSKVSVSLTLCWQENIWTQEELQMLCRTQKRWSIYFKAKCAEISYLRTKAEPVKNSNGIQWLSVLYGHTFKTIMIFKHTFYWTRNSVFLFFASDHSCFRSSTLFFSFIWCQCNGFLYSRPVLTAAVFCFLSLFLDNGDMESKYECG